MNYFRSYQATVGSFLVPHAMLEVLFPFVIAIYLGESPERVGQAQMTLLLPALGVVLFAGVLGDRVDQRRMLLTLHLTNVLPMSGLLIAWWFGRLNYPVMLCFAVASGTATAFVQPTLDAMLNRISGPDLQRTVTATVGVGYAANLLGYLLAGRTDQFGITPLLMCYILIMVSGAWSSARLPAAPPAHAPPRRSVFGEIREGIRTVARSPRMLPPTLLGVFGGLCLGGPHAVLVPLILRDIYGGGAGGIAQAFIAFILGGATSTTVLVRIGGVRWLGRGLITGYVFSGIALCIWSLHVPYWGFLLATAFWGFGGGMCHSTGRTIMLESAPASHRARVMSVSQLAGRGTAPIGSLVMGYLVAAIGPLHGALLAAIGTGVSCLVVVLFTNIWNDRSACADA